MPLRIILMTFQAKQSHNCGYISTLVSLGNMLFIYPRFAVQASHPPLDLHPYC